MHRHEQHWEQNRGQNSQSKMHNIENLEYEQHGPHQKQGVNTVAREGFLLLKRNPILSFHNTNVYILHLYIMSGIKMYYAYPGLNIDNLSNCIAFNSSSTSPYKNNSI